MKITKWVDMGAEVEIEIGMDDIRGKHWMNAPALVRATGWAKEGPRCRMCVERSVNLAGS